MMCNEKTYKWYDMEQSIMQCWEITQDLQLIAEEHQDNDEICNKVLGLKHVYEMRFNKLWNNYEQALQEKFND